jgi:hypothetical protein
VRKLDNQIDIIAKSPAMYSISKKDSAYRKCVMSKQTSIYYSFEKETIVLAALWDNRQNPDNLNL